MMKSMCGLCVLIACALGCGGGGGEDSADAAELGPPDEQTLCSLTIGVSSREDVVETLGTPRASLEAPELGFVDYMYGVMGATDFSQVTGVRLDFDGDGILQDATVINLPFPGCWREQIAAREKLDQ